MIPCAQCGRTGPMEIVKILHKKVLCRACWQAGYRLEEYTDNLSGAPRRSVVVVAPKERRED